MVGISLRSISRPRNPPLGRTRADTERVFRNHLASLHGQPIDGVTRRAVAVAIADVAAEHDKISAKQARSALNMFFIWAVKEGYAESNPVALTNDPSPDVCPNKGRGACF
jgi:site-specific recombinase XerD